MNIMVCSENIDLKRLLFSSVCFKHLKLKRYTRIVFDVSHNVVTEVIHTISTTKSFTCSMKGVYVFFRL